MGKNWLIRTKSNHILGPISKEKVLELYHNGSIKPDDEICSGNGYWFFIRESELVEKYLLGHHAQSFNPISEAKDVLTASGNQSDEPGPTRDDITLVGGLDLSKVKAASQPKPEMATASEARPKADPESAQKKKIKTDNQAKHSDNHHHNHKKQPQQNYLKYVGMFVFIVLFLIIYFRKSILKSFFSEAYNSLVITTAIAQDETVVKKKSF